MVIGVKVKGVDLLAWRVVAKTADAMPPSAPRLVMTAVAVCERAMFSDEQ